MSVASPQPAASAKRAPRCVASLWSMLAQSPMRWITARWNKPLCLRRGYQPAHGSGARRAADLLELWGRGSGGHRGRDPESDARPDGAAAGRKGGDVADAAERPRLAFDPVTHATLFLEVAGDATSERRSLSVVLADAHAHFGSTKLQPGPARIAFENKSGQRTLPGLWVHSPELDALSNRRRPVLTANRLLSNQTFRDLYRSGTFDPKQRFKITSLTILFTDLRGSTALYDRVGDLAAFDLVRDHFGELLAAVAAEGGAVVKTIGDAGCCSGFMSLWARLRGARGPEKLV